MGGHTVSEEQLTDGTNVAFDIAHPPSHGRVQGEVE